MGPTGIANAGLHDRPEERSWLLRAAWTVVALCVTVYGLAHVTDTRWGLIVSQVAFLSIVLLSSVASLLAWRHARRTRSDARFWGPLAVASVLLFCAEAYYSAYQVLVAPSGPDWPSPFDAFNLAAAGAFAALMVTMNRLRGLPASTRVRIWAGISGAIGMSYFAIYWFAVEPLATANGHSHGDAAVWTLYVLQGVVLLIAPFSTFFGLDVPRWRRWQRLIAAALLVLGVGLLLWPLWYVDASGSQDGQSHLVTGIVYLLAYGLLFLGALDRLTDADGAQLMAPLPAPSSVNRPIFDVALSGVAFVAIAAMGETISGLPRESFDRSLLFAGIVLLATALMLRGALGIAGIRSARSQSVVDTLTGTLNRGAVAERLDALASQALDDNEPMSVGVLDLDDFATFNVMEGRSVGDQVLAAVGHTAQELLSGAEFAGRLGGDEFCLVLPRTGVGEAHRRTTAFAEAIAAELSEHGWTLTLSGGVAGLPDHASDAVSLIRAADGALYWAKYGGKNRVVAYDDTVIGALDAEARMRELDARSRMDIVRALAATMDARDQATSYHARNVAALSVLLATALELESDRVEDVRLAAVLHDIGKIAVPDSVLRKRGRLSPGELAVLREHAEVGARILRGTELAPIASWIEGHHERWDGTGYPDGLAGESIPYEARIIAVCDAYDVMLSGGPEHPPLSHGAALQEIDQGMGTAFDPGVAEAFIRVISRRSAAAWSAQWLG